MNLIDGINLENISKIYPSVLVLHGDVQTTISIDWYESNKEKVEFVGYVLIFLTKDGDKIERAYQSFDDMIKDIEKISNLLKK